MINFSFLNYENIPFFLILSVNLSFKMMQTSSFPIIKAAYHDTVSTYAISITSWWPQRQIFWYLLNSFTSLMRLFAKILQNKSNHWFNSLNLISIQYLTSVPVFSLFTMWFLLKKMRVLQFSRWYLWTTNGVKSSILDTWKPTNKNGTVIKAWNFSIEQPHRSCWVWDRFGLGKHCY
jgi:hypothetical protein